MSSIVHNIINNQTVVSGGIIFAGYLMGIFMLIFPGTKWKDYVICVYGGVLFGWIPSLCVTENVILASVCCLLLSAALLYLNNTMKEKEVYLPLWVVSFQAILIAGISLFNEQYENHRISFFVLSIMVSAVVFFILSVLYDFTSENQHFVCGLLGMMLITGSIFQHYRSDYSYFAKDLDGITNDEISIFFYMLKVDFSVFDYQTLFVICLAALLVVYALSRKIVVMILANNKLKLEKDI